MESHDIIVVGASAGGVEALLELVRGFPPGFPAAVFVVSHLPDHAESALPHLLSSRGRLLAVHPQHGEPIRRGQIYVAPRDHHMTLGPGVVELNRGARENRHRPAIDPLFRTAARLYGPRVVGVILTGALSDGAAGLLAVRTSGGVAVVQDPEEAAVPSMPQTARDIAGADHVLPLREIAPLLVRLAAEPVTGRGVTAMTDPMENLPEKVDEDFAAQEAGARRGELTVFTCPECGGALWQVAQTELTRFRCHVGHAYNGETLLEDQSRSLEAALWTAVRIFKEKCALARELALQERERGNVRNADRFEEEARLTEGYSDLILQHVLKVNPRPAGEPATPPSAPDAEAPQELAHED